MNKKTIFIFALLFVFYQTNCSDVNDERITLKTMLTSNNVTSINYNTGKNMNGSYGGDKRLWGIHNMTIEVQGYESVSLIENDICLHPSLFTMSSILWPDDHMLVQRWACVKWFFPLSFGFKVENNSLTIFSSIWKYRLLSPFRAQKTINLTQKINFEQAQSSQDSIVTVTVNDHAAVVTEHTKVQIYSTSAICVAVLVHPIIWFL